MLIYFSPSLSRVLPKNNLHLLCTHSAPIYAHFAPAMHLPHTYHAPTKYSRSVLMAYVLAHLPLARALLYA